MQAKHKHRAELVPTKLYLDKAVWERIKQVASDDDRTATGLLRLFAAQGLARYEKQREQSAA